MTSYSIDRVRAGHRETLRFFSGDGVRFDRFIRRIAGLHGHVHCVIRNTRLDTEEWFFSRESFFARHATLANRKQCTYSDIITLIVGHVIICMRILIFFIFQRIFLSSQIILKLGIFFHI